MAKCLDDLIKAGKGLITRKEAEQIIAAIEKRYNRPMPKAGRNIFERPGKPGKGKPAGPDAALEADGSPSPERRMQEAALEAYQEKLREKSEGLRRQELQVEAQYRRQVQIARLGNNVKAIEALLVDPKGELTLQGRIRAVREQYLAGVTPSLDALAKNRDWRRMKPVEREALLAEAMMDPELTKKTVQRPGQDVRPELQRLVQDLAEKFRVMDNDAFARKNAAGADIKYTPGHIPQLWNPSEVRLFGLKLKDKARLLTTRDGQTRRALLERSRARWIEDVLPKLDRERYVDEETGLPMDDQQLREVMSGIWQTIASNGLTGPLAGEGALASRLSVSREIWFKDPQSWVEANRIYGARDLFSTITGEAQRHAREVALLEMYGPNPTAGFRTDLTYAMQGQALDNPAAGRRGSYRAQIMFDELSGKGIGPPEDRAAVDNLARFDLVSRFFKGTRNMIASAKLGMLPFSQINDLAIFRAMARADGLGTGKTIRSALSLFNPANRRDRALARRHGILAQMVLNDAALRYGGDTGSGQGWTSKLANATVKWSGAQHWTDSLKQAFQINIGWHLADARNLEFDQLPGEFGELVRRYGITAEEWDVIRRAETVKLAGQDTITPHTVARSYHPGMGVDASAGQARKGEGVVREAALKVGAMMAEEADVAILQPGTKERAIASGATFEGTIAGELMRSAFFFKTFSVAMLTKAMPRIVNSGTGLKRAGIMSEFALSMIVAGGLTIQLKELAKGRNPRDMTDPGFWGAAFMQAGGLGIFGDFFFNDANRFGGGFTNTLVGPVGGLFADVQKLTVGNIQQGLEGRDTRASAEAMQMVKNYTPLMNLWYTRLALDHLLFFHVQEAANPGYLRRMKRRVQKQNQSFWWDPGDDIPEVPDLEQAFGGK